MHFQCLLGFNQIELVNINQQASLAIGQTSGLISRKSFGFESDDWCSQVLGKQCLCFQSGQLNVSNSFITFITNFCSSNPSSLIKPTEKIREMGKCKIQKQNKLWQERQTLNKLATVKARSRHGTCIFLGYIFLWPLSSAADMKFSQSSKLYADAAAAHFSQSHIPANSQSSFGLVDGKNKK